MRVSFRFIKEPCIVFVLCLLILIPLNIGRMDSPIQTLFSQVARASDDISDQPTAVILLSEDFEQGELPPEGWTVTVTNKEYSWFPTTLYMHTGNYSAQCSHDPEEQEQDEWLRTPELNFSGLNEIYLNFWWYMSQFWGVYPYDHYDVTVWISTNHGLNWTALWTDDDQGRFDNWVWYNTSLGQPIDLTSYRNEDHVLIAFQYEGIDGAQFNLDDILLYGYKVTNPPEADAGGPYEGYVGEDILFHGTVRGGTSPYTFLWRFGDGTTSTLQTPRHHYDHVGNYTVSLNVTDAIGNDGYDRTVVTIRNMSKIPELIITNVSGGFEIQALIINEGCINATDIQWSIMVQGGFLNLINHETSGTFTCIEQHCCESIGCDDAEGLGSINVVIYVEATNMERVMKTARGFVVGTYIALLTVE